MLLNLPFLTGWLLMCTAPNYAVLCVASVVVGVTIGLTEAPINSYIGEVCQPEIRGMMTACAGRCASAQMPFPTKVRWTYSMWSRTLKGTDNFGNPDVAVMTILKAK